MNHQTKKNYKENENLIFGSKWTLTFFDENLEESWNDTKSSVASQGRKDCFKYFLWFLITMLFAGNLLLITIRKEINEKKRESISRLIILSAIYGFFYLVSFLSYLLLQKKMTSKTKIQKIEKISDGFIFISFSVAINLFIAAFRILILGKPKDPNEEISYMYDVPIFPENSYILLSILFSGQMIFALILFKTIFVFFFTILVNIVIDWIVNIISLGNSCVDYTVARFIFLLSLSFCLYLKLFISKINFYFYVYVFSPKILKGDVKTLSGLANKSAIDTIRHSFISIGLGGEIVYVNKSGENLFRKRMQGGHRTIGEDASNRNSNSGTISSIPIPDYYKTFLANTLVYSSQIEENENNKSNISPSESTHAASANAYAEYSKIFEKILSRIISVNSEIPDFLQAFFNGLKNKKNGNLLMQMQQSNTSCSKYPDNNNNNNNNSNCNKDFSLSKLIEILSNSIIKKSTANFKQNGQAGSVITEVSQFNIQSNVNNNNVPTENVFMIPSKTNTNMSFKRMGGLGLSENNKHGINDSEYLYIGKILLKANRTGSIDYNNISQNSNQMKELFLYYKYNNSTLTFDFILEDNSSLLHTDRKEIISICKSLFLSKISHEFRNPLCKMLDIKNFINEEINSNSEINVNINSISYDSEEYTEKKISLEKINLNSLKNHVQLLGNACEVLLLLVKDFSFYSQEEDDTRDPREIEKKLSIKCAKIFSNNENSKCDHFKIISDLIEIFRLKSQSERNENQLKFTFTYASNAPDTIEYNKEIFTSLIFNLLYQAYKTLLSGNVQLHINLSMLNTCFPGRGRGIISYELSLTGVMKMGTIITMGKGEDIVKRALDREIKDIIEEESTERKKENRDDCNSPAVLKNASGVLRCHSMLKDNQPCALIPMKDATYSVLSIQNDGENITESITENFQVMSLINILDSNLRSSVLEEFTNSFCIIMGKLYAKKLGTRLIIENHSQNESKISFSLEYTIADGSPGEAVDSPSSSNFLANTKKTKILSYIRPFNKPDEKKPLKLQAQGTTLTDNFPKFTQHLHQQSSASASDASNYTIKTNHAMHVNYSAIKNLNPKLVTMKSEQDITTKPQVIPTIPTSTIVEVISKMKKQGLSMEIPMPKENTLKRVGNFSTSCNISKKNKMSLCNSLRKTPRPTLNESSMNLTSISLDTICKETDLLNKGNTFRVLLTDDEVYVRNSLMKFFQKITKEFNWTIDIKQAENGFECLAHVYKSHLEGKKFDLMIIDENMPFMKGSDVISLLKRIMNNGEFASFMIVSYTSYDNPVAIKLINDCGADYVINKPIKYDDFKALLKNLRSTGRLNEYN